MIKLTFTGNLACNCEQRNFNNKPYFYFRVAANVSREQTDFITCFVNFDISKLAPYLTVGKSVYIEGRPRISTYQDREGKFQARYDVNVTELELMSRKSEDSSTQPSENN